MTQFPLNFFFANPLNIERATISSEVALTQDYKCLMQAAPSLTTDDFEYTLPDHGLLNAYDESTNLSGLKNLNIPKSLLAVLGGLSGLSYRSFLGGNFSDYLARSYQAGRVPLSGPIGKSTNFLILNGPHDDTDGENIYTSDRMWRGRPYVLASIFIRVATQYVALNKTFSWRMISQHIPVPPVKGVALLAVPDKAPKHLQEARISFMLRYNYPYIALEVADSKKDIADRAKIKSSWAEYTLKALTLSVSEARHRRNEDKDNQIFWGNVEALLGAWDEAMRRSDLIGGDPSRFDLKATQIRSENESTRMALEKAGYSTGIAQERDKQADYWESVIATFPQLIVTSMLLTQTQTKTTKKDKNLNAKQYFGISPTIVKHLGAYRKYYQKTLLGSFRADKIDENLISGPYVAYVKMKQAIRATGKTGADQLKIDAALDQTQSVDEVLCTKANLPELLITDNTEQRKAYAKQIKDWQRTIDTVIFPRPASPVSETIPFLAVDHIVVKLLSMHNEDELQTKKVVFAPTAVDVNAFGSGEQLADRFVDTGRNIERTLVSTLNAISRKMQVDLSGYQPEGDGLFWLSMWESIMEGMIDEPPLFSRLIAAAIVSDENIPETIRKKGYLFAPGKRIFLIRTPVTAGGEIAIRSSQTNGRTVMASYVQSEGWINKDTIPLVITNEKTSAASPGLFIVPQTSLDMPLIIKSLFREIPTPRSTKSGTEYTWENLGKLGRSVPYPFDPQIVASSPDWGRRLERALKSYARSLEVEETLTIEQVPERDRLSVLNSAYMDTIIGLIDPPPARGGRAITGGRAAVTAFTDVRRGRSEGSGRRARRKGDDIFAVATPIRMGGVYAAAVSLLHSALAKGEGQWEKKLGIEGTQQGRSEVLSTMLRTGLITQAAANKILSGEGDKNSLDAYAQALKALYSAINYEQLPFGAFETPALPARYREEEAPSEFAREFLSRTNPRRRTSRARRLPRASRSNPDQDDSEGSKGRVPPEVLAQAYADYLKAPTQENEDRVRALLAESRSPVTLSGVVQATFPRQGKRDDFSDKVQLRRLAASGLVRAVNRPKVPREIDDELLRSWPVNESVAKALGESSELSLNEAARLLSSQRKSRATAKAISASGAICKTRRTKKLEQYELSPAFAELSPISPGDKYARTKTLILLSPDNASPVRAMTWRHDTHVDCDVVARPGEGAASVLSLALQSALYWLAEKESRQKKTTVYLARIGSPEVYLLWEPGDPVAMASFINGMKSPMSLSTYNQQERERDRAAYLRVARGKTSYQEAKQESRFAQGQAPEPEPPEQEEVPTQDPYLTEPLTQPGELDLSNLGVDFGEE